MDAEERSRLRKQALAWLGDVLKGYAALANDPRPASRQDAARMLRHLLKDEDFTGVRDAKALDGLPAEERKAWQAFWAEAKDLLAKAEAPAK